MEANNRIFKHLDLSGQAILSNAGLYLARRQGNPYTTPETLLVAAKDRVAKKSSAALKKGGDPAKYNTVLRGLETYHSEALAYMAWCLDHAQKPAKEIRERRQVQEEKHRTAAMQGQPPTQRQLDLLASLSFGGRLPRTSAEAASVIDALLRQQRERAGRRASR